MHTSLVLRGGDMNVTTLEELRKMPRTRDILYIPFLHYMNIVNPSKGIITASSRFGALLLKKDGSVAVPFMCASRRVSWICLVTRWPGFPKRPRRTILLQVTVRATRPPWWCLIHAGTRPGDFPLQRLVLKRFISRPPRFPNLGGLFCSKFSHCK